MNHFIFFLDFYSGVKLCVMFEFFSSTHCYYLFQVNIGIWNSLADFMMMMMMMIRMNIKHSDASLNTYITFLTFIRNIKYFIEAIFRARRNPFSFFTFITQLCNEQNDNGNDDDDYIDTAHIFHISIHWMNTAVIADVAMEEEHVPKVCTSCYF